MPRITCHDCLRKENLPVEVEVEVRGWKYPVCGAVVVVNPSPAKATQPHPNKSNAGGSGRDLLSALAVAAVALVTLLIWDTLPSRHGSLQHFNDGDLYYTSRVTRAQVEKLGDYMTQVDYFNGERKTVQLTREGCTYQVRCVVKKGIDSDAEFISIFKASTAELPLQVFDGQPVETHLCADKLLTLRMVVKSLG